MVGAVGIEPTDLQDTLHVRYGRYTRLLYPISHSV